MIADEIIAEIEKRLGTLDERAREAVELALQLAEEKLQLRWQGENPTWDEWQRMDEEERMKVMDELEERNRKWLEWIRETLGVEWMLVVDGKLIRFDVSWDAYPTDKEIEVICQVTGKVPLLFAATPVIEESALWHPTRYVNDFYPSLVLSFSNAAGRSVVLEADFDTGAIRTFADADLLQRHKVVGFSLTTLWAWGIHLGQAFRYTPIPLKVALVAEDGSTQETLHTVLCVRNWQQSPFVAVNPNRTALVGRSLCLSLKPKITMDFEQKVTNLHW